mmetsp:Transcript_43171/g.92092  ORF Transcript_43171/g.92092 Transcript_43171/m.92092 type:complete len:201 (+) Transcript_43171:281-883(+)
MQVRTQVDRLGVEHGSLDEVVGPKSSVSLAAPRLGLCVFFLSCRRGLGLRLHKRRTAAHGLNGCLKVQGELTLAPDNHFGGEAVGAMACHELSGLAFANLCHLLAIQGNLECRRVLVEESCHVFGLAEYQPNWLLRALVTLHRGEGASRPHLDVGAMGDLHDGGNEFVLKVDFHSLAPIDEELQQLHALRDRVCDIPTAI